MPSETHLILLILQRTSGISWFGDPMNASPRKVLSGSLQSEASVMNDLGVKKGIRNPVGPFNILHLPKHEAHDGRLTVFHGVLCSWFTSHLAQASF